MTTEPTYPIEGLPGESIDDAIKRLAAGLKDAAQPVAGDDKAPKKKAEPKVTVSDPSAGDTIDNSIYSCIHVYQRIMPSGTLEPEGSVRVNGTRERKMHGPNTLVFVHMHPYGVECTPACRERVAS